MNRLISLKYRSTREQRRSSSGKVYDRTSSRQEICSHFKIAVRIRCYSMEKH